MPLYIDIQYIWICKYMEQIPPAWNSEPRMTVLAMASSSLPDRPNGVDSVL
jgi:hypothetical protein